MKQYQIFSAIALSIVAASASALPVSVTADFTKFTMGVQLPRMDPLGNYINPLDYVSWMESTGLSVNGKSIDICKSDPNCAGVFANPSNVTTDLAGSMVSFGYANGPSIESNLFSFVGNTDDVLGTGSQNQFKLGTMTFTNGGMYWIGQVYLDFVLTTHSSDVNYDNHTFSGSIRLDTNSSFDFNPEANADYFTIQDVAGNVLSDLGSIRVYDQGECPAADISAPNCNSGSVDLFGHINSLHLDRFGNPTGGVFLNPSTGSALTKTQTQSVPEPATGVLLALGMAGMVFSRGSKKGRGRIG